MIKTDEKTPPRTVWDELRDDLVYFGAAFSRRKADGSIERIDPRDVLLKVPAIPPATEDASAAIAPSSATSAQKDTPTS